MLALAIATSLAASAACPATNAKADVIALHETARQAHLTGNADLMSRSIGGQLLLAEKGGIRVQKAADVIQFFKGYFGRVRYSEWRDVTPPLVEVSPDGQMAWMAVAIAARYTRADRPAEPAKTFNSSWIATYARVECAWRMTGIASDVVE